MATRSTSGKKRSERIDTFEQFYPALLQEQNLALLQQNKAIIQENVNLKQQTAELKKDLLKHQQEIMMERAKNRQLLDCITQIATSAHKKIFAMTNEFANNMTFHVTELINKELMSTMESNQSLCKTVLESSVAKTPNQSYKQTPRHTRHVRPMVSGHTIEKPTVNLQRVSLENINQRNKSIPKESENSENDQNEINIDNNDMVTRPVCVLVSRMAVSNEMLAISEEENNDNNEEEKESSLQQDSCSSLNTDTFPLHTLVEVGEEDASARDYVTKYVEKPMTSSPVVLVNRLNVYLNSPVKSSNSNTTDSSISEEINQQYSQTDALRVLNLTPGISPRNASTPIKSVEPMAFVTTRRNAFKKRSANEVVFKTSLPKERISSRENISENDAGVTKRRKIKSLPIRSCEESNDKSEVSSEQSNISAAKHKSSQRKSNESPIEHISHIRKSKRLSGSLNTSRRTSNSNNSQSSSFNLNPSPRPQRRNKRSNSSGSYKEPSLRKKMRQP